MKELLLLWDGISINTTDSGTQTIFVCCDLPASKKVCGFLSHSANLGCLCEFSTGEFGIQNYSGFNRDRWTPRSNVKHREDVKATLVMTAKSKKESEVGCRYSGLLKLPL